MWIGLGDTSDAQYIFSYAFFFELQVYPYLANY